MATDLSALHANIFGDECSDDEDDAPEVQHATGVDDDEDGEGRAAEILESRNNLLISGKKAKEKEKASNKSKGKQGGSSGRGKRKSAPDADELAAAGLAREQKRLKKQQEREERLARGEAEGGEGGEGVGEEDPDDDSVDGSEAVEEGGKKDFDRILNKLKAKRGTVQYSREKLTTEVQELQKRMEDAAEADDDAIRSDPPTPAWHKVAMLPEVEAIMVKKQYHEVMIDHGMLSTLSRWLRPMQDGNLVSLEVRTGLLNSLLRLDVDETVLGALRSSGIGKYIKLLTLHKRETKGNKRVALQLIEKWSRPIFQTSDKVKAQDIPIADIPARRVPRAQQQEESAFAAPSGPDRQNHARVPRPMGMDFQMLPASAAQPLPSSKYAKDSIKGRLSDRILNGKRKASTQAVTLSVEGRTLDRLG